METIQFDQLKANPNNPRTLSKHDGIALQNSIKRFGDLSGIVFNTRSGQLVGGHQRTETFKKMGGEKSVTISLRFETPNDVGTTAVGYITFNHEHFAYREVDWDEATELAANVAANRIGGDFDLEKLADINMFLEQSNVELLKLTGQTNEEIDKLKNLGSEPEQEKESKKGYTDLSFSFTNDQAELVQEALDYVSTQIKIQHPENISVQANAIWYIATKYLEQLHAEQEIQISNEIAEADPQVPGQA